MCDATKNLNDGGTLACDIPGVSHELHYDEADDVSWTEGRPE